MSTTFASQFKPISMELECPEQLDNNNNNSTMKQTASAAKSQPRESLAFGEYDREILETLLDVERQGDHLPKHDYLDSVQGGRIKMWERDVIIQWILETCEAYDLHPETIGLSVSIFDRFMSHHVVCRDYMQLVGAGAVLIACKQLETEIIAIADLQAACDHAFTADDLRALELLMLRTLRWAVSPAHSHIAARAVLAVMPAPLQSAVMTETTDFFVDLTYAVYRFLKYTPTTIGASAMACAMGKRGADPSETMAELCSTFGMDLDAVQRCSREMLQLFQKVFAGQEQQQATEQVAAPMAVDVATNEPSTPHVNGNGNGNGNGKVRLASPVSIVDQAFFSSA